MLIQISCRYRFLLFYAQLAEWVPNYSLQCPFRQLHNQILQDGLELSYPTLPDKHSPIRLQFRILLNQHSFICVNLLSFLLFYAQLAEWVPNCSLQCPFRQLHNQILQDGLELSYPTLPDKHSPIRLQYFTLPKSLLMPLAETLPEVLVEV